ncbi:Amino-acid acetyltransferase [Streptomyces sp. MBT84]|nr:Amino-acid acetyltransferase [Streptomyces sp. MBT84]
MDFFGKHGFVEIGETPVDTDVYAELMRSYDEGVAEFLGLERVKPNTLGNSRMLLYSVIAFKYSAMLQLDDLTRVPYARNAHLSAFGACSRALP